MNISTRAVATTAGRARRGGRLECEHLRVSFATTIVLNGASLAVEPGEVHVVVGPNGAGKTTLANVVCGHLPARAGRVLLDGVPLTGPPHRRARRGLGRKFQVPRVFPRLTAREQLRLAAPHADLSHLESELAEIDALSGDQLSHGWRQWLELQMVLLQAPSVVVLDEPTAGLARNDRHRLAEAIEAVDFGTFLVVEHDLDFVARIAHRVSFMHDGRVVRTGSYDEIIGDPMVRAAYLGTTADVD